MPLHILQKVWVKSENVELLGGSLDEQGDGTGELGDAEHGGVVETQGDEVEGVGGVRSERVDGIVNGVTHLPIIPCGMVLNMPRHLT